MAWTEPSVAGGPTHATPRSPRRLRRRFPGSRPQLLHLPPTESGVTARSRSALRYRSAPRSPSRRRTVHHRTRPPPERRAPRGQGDETPPEQLPPGASDAPLRVIPLPRLARRTFRGRRCPRCCAALASRRDRPGRGRRRPPPAAVSPDLTTVCCSRRSPPHRYTHLPHRTCSFVDPSNTIHSFRLVDR